MPLPVQQQRRYSIDEYLRIEADSPEKHEYWDGVIVPLSQLIAMAGGTYKHGMIAMNTAMGLANRLAGGPCRVTGSDVRIRIPRTPFYFYPDASVVCGPPEFDLQAAEGTTVLNPRVVVEVLSPSTEASDRGKKLRRYMQIPALEEYVLVSQAEPHVDSFFRHKDGSWTFDVADGLKASVRIRSLGVRIPMAEIYAHVEFPPEPSATTKPTRRRLAAPPRKPRKKR